MRTINFQRSTWIKEAVLLVIFSFISLDVFAAEIAGVRFNQNYLNHGINMSLQGTGLKTMFFFKAFAAGFYKTQGLETDVLGNYPKRIEVEYFVSIPGSKLNGYTIERMKDNVSKADLESLKDKIKQMGSYFVDLKPGDRFSLTYIPGIGTEFAHNDRVTGIISGLDFAKALFAVWIGEKPFDQNLKQQVLGIRKT